jgi:hypothetical protein
MHQLRISRSPTRSRSRGMNLPCSGRTDPVPSQHPATLAKPGHARPTKPEVVSRRNRVLPCESRSADLPHQPSHGAPFFSPIVDVEAPPRRTPNSNNKADRRLPLTPCCALGNHERSLVTSWKGRRCPGMSDGSRGTGAVRTRHSATLAHRLRRALAEWTPPALSGRTPHHETAVHVSLTGARPALAERTPPHSRRTDGT